QVAGRLHRALVGGGTAQRLADLADPVDGAGRQAIRCAEGGAAMQRLPAAGIQLGPEGLFGFIQAQVACLDLGRLDPEGQACRADEQAKSMVAHDSTLLEPVVVMCRPILTPMPRAAHWQRRTLL